MSVDEEILFNKIFYNNCEIKLDKTMAKENVLYYSKGENFSIISANKINVESINDINELLAISYGLAQSTILAYYEAGVEKTIDNTREIPIQMIEQGKILLSNNQIKKNIGEIFVLRSAINLYSEILDSLDIFWENDELENFYQRIRTFSNMERRLVLLRKRMSILKELYDILNNQIEFKSSLTTEWFIVYFVILDIFLSIVYKFILKDYFELF